MSLELPSQALHSHCSEQWEAGEAEEQNRQQEQEPTVVGRSQARGWGCRVWPETALRAQRGNDEAGKIRRNLNFTDVNLINDPGSLF